MNREIKFRAWICNDDEGCWMAKWNRHVKRIFGTFVARDDNGTARLMQYTGLTDKNGREIYEADIVFDDLGPYLVVYDPYGWQPFAGDPYHEDLLTGDDVEVVGNKFENPELLDDRDT